MSVVHADIGARLGAVVERIERASEGAGRDPDDVRILLATKTVPVDAIRAAFEAERALVDSRPRRRGMVLGENRVQELVAKAPELADHGSALHVIGPLQSNKVGHALRWASCVESVGSLTLARRLAERAVTGAGAVDVLVQVNVSGEPTKHGTTPESAVDLATAVGSLDGLRLRGFMTVGAHTSDDRAVRAGYALLRRLRDEVVASGAPGTTAAVELSMGMSRDLELAIAEGATTVRVGSAVFGERRA